MEETPAGAKVWLRETDVKVEAGLTVAGGQSCVAEEGNFVII